MKKRRDMGDHATAHSPHPLDVALGTRIRLRRHELGLSQAQLARQLGITFQQVQKYEGGMNRVSFSRLVEIARALRCEIMDIVGDLASSQASAVFSQHVTQLNEPGAMELLAFYAAIQSPKHRRAILNLAKQLADGKSVQVSE